jgi:Na+-driven multidrug efflux pump
VGGQVVSAAMGAWFFFGQRRRPYRIRAIDLRWHRPTLGALAAVGAPSFLAGFGVTALAVLVNNALAHTGGTTALAAYAVASRIQTFVLMPQFGISQGLQPVVGYNVGRRRFDRVQRALILSLRATLGYGAVMAAAAFLFAGPLVSTFVDDVDTAGTATRALRLTAGGFVVAGVTPLVSAYFQALGRAAPSYLISVGTLLAVKAPLVLAATPTGPTGIWAGLAIGELLSALVAVLILRCTHPGPRAGE